MPFYHEAILVLDFFSPLVDAFLHITRGLRPLVIWGNASPRGGKKSNTRIASCGKPTCRIGLKSYVVDMLYFLSIKLLCLRFQLIFGVDKRVINVTEKEFSCQLKIFTLKSTVHL